MRDATLFFSEQRDEWRVGPQGFMLLGKRVCSRFVLVALTLFFVVCGTQAASAGALPLEKIILGKQHQVELMMEMFAYYKQDLMLEIPKVEEEARELERSFHEIIFLLSISDSNFFEFRLLYKELYGLSKETNILADRIDMEQAILESNKRKMQSALKDLEPLSSKVSNLKLGTTLEELRVQLTQMLAQIHSVEALINGPSKLVDDLKRKVNKANETLGNEVGSLLKVFITTPLESIFSVDTWYSVPYASLSWVQTLPFTALAKFPGNWADWFLVLGGGIGIWCLVFFPGRIVLRRKLSFLESEHAYSLSQFIRAYAFFVAGVSLKMALISLESPEHFFLQKVSNIFFIKCVLDTAWGLRTLWHEQNKSSPAMPLFYLYLWGMFLQITNFSWVMLAIIWPISVAVMLFLLPIRKLKSYSTIERGLLTFTFVAGVVTLLFALAGYLFLSLFMAFLLLLVFVGIQFGSSLTFLLRRYVDQHENRLGSVTRGVVTGMGTSVTWLVVLGAIFGWLMHQFGEFEFVVQFINNKKLIYIFLVLVVLVLVNKTLTIALAIYNTFPYSKCKPLKGYVQLAKIFVYLIAIVVLACIIMDKTPWGILGGIGALTAVLVVVFRDTILSVVASLQIGAYDLVRIGDWIQVEKLGVDGDVVDVALHTIKVQNFDKTIISVPTSKLVEEPFKNWRGMREAGGRRIKRSIIIDKSSIAYVDQTQLQKLKDVELLEKFFSSEEALIALPGVREHKADAPGPCVLNSRALTNVGVFRAYAEEYLHRHPFRHKDYIFMVRQLQPTGEGLPLEVYIFITKTVWKDFEKVQSDIFDHLLAAAPLFELRMFQYPTGHDLKSMNPIMHT